MTASRLMLAPVTLLLCCPADAGMVYRLNESPYFEGSSFGFSGTVTTDGSLGLQTSVSFIESWSITVRTPSAVDGVGEETLTPANSTVSLALNGDPGLTLSAQSISMPVKSFGIPATLTWSTANDETTLSFSNRFTDAQGIGAGESIYDSSESAGIGVVLRDAPLASAVPEPAAAWLIASVAFCGRVQRRGRQMSRMSMFPPSTP